MKFKICTYGNAILRQQAVRIETVDDDIKQLASDMLETMYAENGLGLAAEQVGKTVALCVIDIPAEGDIDQDGVRLNPDIPMPLVLINPEICELSPETDMREEGCLSFPKIYAPIKRSISIRFKYTDLEGEERELGAQALLARAIQHELDHLDGVLFVDHMSQIKKIAMSGRLKRLRKQSL